MADPGRVALYSQELGIDPKIPIYSGGLGVLNGDKIKAASELGYPEVFTGLMFHDGYFTQGIAKSPCGYYQVTQPTPWDPEKEGFELKSTVAKMRLWNNEYILRPWVKNMGSVDIVLLDGDFKENGPEFREAFGSLYDNRNFNNRKQNMILGVGGPTMLEALGYDIKKHHMQEGHASALVLKLLNDELNKGKTLNAAVESVKEKCIFTNHTPIQAGMPKYKPQEIADLIGYLFPTNIAELAFDNYGQFNTNLLAANMSGYINGVSRLHGEVMAQKLEEFKGKEVHYITNGVHHSFMNDGLKNLIVSRIGTSWMTDSKEIRKLEGRVTPEELDSIFRSNKQNLIDMCNDSPFASPNKMGMDEMLLGWARRFTDYKRPDMFFAALPLLKDMPLNFLSGGKSHPNDGGGMDKLSYSINNGMTLNHNKHYAFIQDYKMASAKTIFNGVDLWLFTPRPIEEASGTSPMDVGQAGKKSVATGGFIPEADPKYVYTFSEENCINSFADAIKQAHKDWESGEMAKSRLETLMYFIENFSAARMERQYGEVYGFEKPAQNKLENLVLAK
jgi:glycogen phosphorylase